VKEYEIRPKNVFDEFLNISLRESERLFSDKSKFIEVSCPACGSSRLRQAFLKNNFNYETCKDCSSLFVNPRPNSADLSAYYRDSGAVEHWAKIFYKDTEGARRARIVKPRAKMIEKWAKQMNVDGTFCDVGSGFGLLLEEIKELGIFEEIIGVEPASDLAQICRDRGFRIFEKNVEDLDAEEERANFATCFEVIEHVFEPLEFLRAASNILIPGGVFIFSTLTISGFDLGELWSNSKSVCPPNHLNLMSVSGLAALVKRCGLELVDLSTPGMLDVDILRNMLEENSEISISRFARQISEANETVQEKFQNFLQENRLSSHVVVVARKIESLGEDSDL
jgi:2-polyprenyl-3-methyl-5-hydroxy-6-metoxy-1,4-benzoquinol methylase